MVVSLIPVSMGKLPQAALSGQKLKKKEKKMEWIQLLLLKSLENTIL